MKFIDVTALSDASVATDDNQSIGNLESLEVETDQADYGTFELNQFVLDGNKNVMPDFPGDIVFWSVEQSERTAYFRKILDLRLLLVHSIHRPELRCILRMNILRS